MRIGEIVRLVIFCLIVAALVRGGMAASKLVDRAVRVRSPAAGPAPMTAPHVRPTLRTS